MNLYFPYIVIIIICFCFCFDDLVSLYFNVISTVDSDPEDAINSREIRHLFAQCIVRQLVSFRLS